MLTGYNPNDLNLRKTPQGEVIRLMPKNTQLTGDEIVIAADGGKWFHVLTTNGKAEVGYCASWLVTYTTPPPPTGEVKPTSMDVVLHYKDGTTQAVNGIVLPNAT